MQSRSRLIRATLGVLAVVLALAACGSSSSSSSADGSGQQDALGQWQLVGGTIDGAPMPLVDGYRITMTLEAGGDIHGTAACNGYGGTYTLDGSDLSVANLGWTEMGCEPAVMESEAAFVNALQRATTLEKSADELTLSGDDVDLRFERVPPVEPAALVGTTWTLDTLIDGDTATSVMGEPTLVLDADGTMTGSTGCRELTGNYRVEGDVLAFSRLAAEGECPTELRDQDSAVVSVLENAAIAIDGTRLTLTSSGGEGLSYRSS